jgi:hypothetical protein
MIPIIYADSATIPVGHGVLSPLRSRGGDTEWPCTSAYPARSICRPISGEVEAMVTPRGIAMPTLSHGPPSGGRLPPVSSTVNPNSSGVSWDWKTCPQALLLRGLDNGWASFDTG